MVEIRYKSIESKIITSRSSHPEVFLGKGVLLCNFIEIALALPVNLLHIFRKSFPRNTSGRLLLYFKFISW